MTNQLERPTTSPPSRRWALPLKFVTSSRRTYARVKEMPMALKCYWNVVFVVAYTTQRYRDTTGSGAVGAG